MLKHADTIGAGLIAAIVVDDFERNALIFFQHVRIRDVVGMHEHVGASIIRNDETKTSSVIVVRNFSNRHFSQIAFSVVAVIALVSFRPVHPWCELVDEEGGHRAGNPSLPGYCARAARDDAAFATRRYESSNGTCSTMTWTVASTDVFRALMRGGFSQSYANAGKLIIDQSDSTNSIIRRR